MPLKREGLGVIKVPDYQRLIMNAVREDQLKYKANNFIVMDDPRIKLEPREKVEYVPEPDAEQPF